MEDQTALLALLPVVEQRVNRRLAHWPIVHREDVVQDAVVKLVALFNDTDRIAAIVNLDAYAERLIGNAIIDAIREHAADRQMVLLNHELAAAKADERLDESDPADFVADAELAALAGQNLKLTGKQQRLFDLFRQSGTKGIADALGISRQTACERASRLLRAIREQQADAA